MSHFYGTVKGQAKTPASRLGTKKSGLVTHCASWQGAIRCEAYLKDGIDCVKVSKVRWKGAGEERMLYDGPFGSLPFRLVKQITIAQ